MNVAIIGRGFSGLGLAFHFFNLVPKAKITFFDQGDFLNSASANSTGLFHCFVGKSSKKSPYADEAFPESLHLIQSIEKYSNLSLIEKTGLIKLASTDLQIREFKESAEKHKLQFLEEQAIKDFNVKALAALYIEQAFTVKPREYLTALWSYCKAKGAKLIKKEVQNLKELEGFDTIILACGASKLLEPFFLPTDAIKGQMLVCENNVSSFSEMPINSKGHVTFYDKVCFLGSTYERSFSNEKPDLLRALKIKEDIEAFYPQVKNFKVLECRAGIRLSRKRSPLPIVGHLRANIWALTALGSRGLLYHGLFSKLLAKTIITDDKNLLKMFC